MKILQLTSYPTSKPIHGGQIRCASIATELRRAGHYVKSVSIYVADDYEPDGPSDIAFGTDSEFWNSDLPFLSDYYSGIFVLRDATANMRLVEAFEEFSPDVVVVEHPWLMQAAERLCAMRENVRLVYSSHNVEYRLKEAILRRAGVNSSLRKKIVNEIQDLEKFSINKADLSICCTQSDADFYHSLESSANIVVCGNGVERFECRTSRVEQWRRFVRQPFPIFVSSAHPPNANGFWDMMAPGLTFLRPDERMVIAGSVSEIILNMSGAREYQAFNQSRLEILGRMAKVELQAVISASHLVLLPITSGEGSNLKTAEALESGCAIVATSKAFRGFEGAMALPHVHIADDPQLFRRRIRELLDKPRYAAGTPHSIRSQFYWSSLLKNGIQAIERL